ncbi:D-alanine--D-alanine ligase [Congregibacter litoralis]|uniref:D-alanine--D-alanine ligase n=1 Tax=Congregibacter litoralis KT71 TaxID=314285 RepID=A4A5G2_9GAMM|nr:D-alanine--D-alanine ligase [Congregibacter litoralis]EAQ99033.1 D-alanine--D-alanine ligase [Congregibacter litoralis KT71]
MSVHSQVCDLRIAVLFGGTSGERKVSLASADTVLTTLRDGGYEPLALDTGEPRWWERLEDADIAFNIQHGVGGEDGVTQGLLASMGVVGTGSDVLGSALAMDKLRSKQLWRSLGLPTANFAMVDAHTDAAALLSEWGAAFIKPSAEGSSLGMSRVDSVDGFKAACEAAAVYGEGILAEEFIDGPEYTVAILGDRALPPIRIEASREFYDYEAKYKGNSTRYHIPCGLSDGEEETLCRLALEAFAALGCSIWGRVDLMRNRRGEFQLLEVNTVPGMTDHSLVPMAAKAAGMSLLELLEEILLLSWQAGAAIKGRAA